MESNKKQDVSTAKRPQKASLRAVKRLLWSAILRTSHVVETSDDETLIVKASHGLSQLASAFQRLHDATVNDKMNKLIAQEAENLLKNEP